MTEETGARGARTILLIGASSGIGRAAAVRLASGGHRLALAARRRALLDSVAASLPGGSTAHLVLPFDVKDAAAVEAAADRAEARLGPLDTLVYCAGGARFAPLEETDDTLWAEMLDGNLTGLFHAARVVLPRFRRLGRGHIVAVLSIASRQAFPNSTAYTAAKFGALGFIESLRAEVRGASIHVTAVLPGATDTPLWDPMGESWDRSKMMRPEQAAGLIAAVLDETSSGMIEEIRFGPVEGPL